MQLKKGQADELGRHVRGGKEKRTEGFKGAKDLKAFERERKAMGENVKVTEDPRADVKVVQGVAERPWRSAQRTCSKREQEAGSETGKIWKEVSQEVSMVDRGGQE
ncbi:MAG: hypothetical protein ACKPKO_21080 [Candidatus Fonsibacter sp.]